MKKFCNEFEAINIFNKIMKKSSMQLNKPYESDCEILQFDNSNPFVLNIDEFSDEDMFYTLDSYLLGYNIAIGSISDIIASGSYPVFYGHSISVQWSREYLTSFAKGVNEVLKYCNTGFIGGDFSFSKQWKCSVTVLGKPFYKTLTRKNMKKNELLYVSGKIGIGNLHALLKLKPEILELSKDNSSDFFELLKFNCRLKEMEVISKYATACIDTSDGLIESLNIISDLNDLGFIIENIPYNVSAEKFFSMLGFNKIILACGGAGEYELLFTIPERNEPDFLNEMTKYNYEFYKIGKLTETKEKIFIEKNKKINLKKYDFNARSFESLEKYIQYITLNFSD